MKCKEHFYKPFSQTTKTSQGEELGLDIVQYDLHCYIIVDS